MVHDPVKWEVYIDAIKSVNRELQELTKTQVREFFPEEYESLMKTLRRAFLKGENNSLLLLARSKATMCALTSKVQQDIATILKQEDPLQDFRVVQINCTMNNSEAKMVQKFCQTLGLQETHEKNSMFTVDMINQVKKYFE